MSTEVNHATIQDFINAYGITAEFETVPIELLPLDRIRDYKGGDHHRVIIRNEERVMVVPIYSRGKDLLGDSLKLSDVLGSLQCDYIQDGETFESWAEEFGYDADSRRAEATYKACLQESYSLRNLLGDLVANFLDAEE